MFVCGGRGRRRRGWGVLSARVASVCNPGTSVPSEARGALGLISRSFYCFYLFIYLFGLSTNSQSIHNLPDPHPVRFKNDCAHRSGRRLYKWVNGGQLPGGGDRPAWDRPSAGQSALTAPPCSEHGALSKGPGCCQELSFLGCGRPCAWGRLATALGRDLRLRAGGGGGGAEAQKEHRLRRAASGRSLDDPGPTSVLLAAQDPRCPKGWRRTPASPESPSGRERARRPPAPSPPPAPAGPGSRSGGGEAHRDGLRVLQGSPLSYLGKSPASGPAESGGVKRCPLRRGRQFVTLLK